MNRVLKRLFPFLFIVCFLLPCLADEGTGDSPFFKKLKSSPPKASKSLIETRIKFMAKRGVSLEPQKTFGFYINNIDLSFDKKLVFLNQELSKGKNKKLMQQFWYSALEPIDVKDKLQRLKALSNNELNGAIVDQLRRRLAPKDFDLALKHPKLYERVFTNPPSDQIYPAVRFSQLFGFYKEADVIVNKHKSELKRDQWGNIQICKALYRNSNFDDAVDCLKTFQSPWYRSFSIYVSFLKKEKNTKASEALAEIRKDPKTGDKLRVFLEIIEILTSPGYKTTANKNFNSLLASSRYFLGFTLIRLAQKNKSLPKSDLKVLVDGFKRNFPNSYFLQVLENKISTKNLKKRFSKNSITYYAL